MVDTATVLIIIPLFIGVITLLIKQFFTCYKDVKSSDCFNGAIHIEAKDEPDTQITHRNSSPPIPHPPPPVETEKNKVESV